MHDDLDEQYAAIAEHHHYVADHPTFQSGDEKEVFIYTFVDLCILQS